MTCLGEVEGCAAEAFYCQCGVWCCASHGHAEVGDDRSCPNLIDGVREEPEPGPCFEDIDLSQYEGG